MARKKHAGFAIGDSVTHLSYKTYFPYFDEVFAHGGNTNLLNGVEQNLGEGSIFTVIRAGLGTSETIRRIDILAQKIANLNQMVYATPLMDVISFGGQYEVAMHLISLGADVSQYGSTERTKATQDQATRFILIPSLCSLIAACPQLSSRPVNYVDPSGLKAPKSKWRSETEQAAKNSFFGFMWYTPQLIANDMAYGVVPEASKGICEGVKTTLLDVPVDIRNKAREARNRARERAANSDNIIDKGAAWLIGVGYGTAGEVSASSAYGLMLLPVAETVGSTQAAQTILSSPLTRAAGTGLTVLGTGASAIDDYNNGDLSAITILGLQGIYSINSTPTTGTRWVSRWGRDGLQTDDWVMAGKPSPCTYIGSFKWQPGMGNQFAPYSSGRGYEVPNKDVVWPSGWGIDGRWKGIFGQRIYIGPGQK